MNKVNLVRFYDRRPEPLSIRLGNKLENLAETVRFELPAEYAGAAAFLHLQMGAYADVIQLNKDLSFTPTRTQTQSPGSHTGYIEILAANDVVWKSDIFHIHIGDLPNDGAQIEQQYPTAFEEALRAAAELTSVTPVAETLPAGSEATIRRDTNADGKPLLIYGIPKGDTGMPGAKGESFTYEDFTPEQLVALKGEDGYTPQKGVDYFDGKDGTSPKVDVTAIDGGNRVTITDADGPKSFDVMDGKDGKDGDGGSGGEPVPGENGGYYIPEISEEGDLSWMPTKANMPEIAPVNIKGPQGEKGDTGADGTQGPKGDKGDTGGVYRPSLAPLVDATTGEASGYTLEWHYRANTSGASGPVQIKHGRDGEKGDPGIQGPQGEKGETGSPGRDGKDGYTPQKGVDYFDGKDGYTPIKGTDYYTTADKNEMVSLVLAALPTWTGGSY